jgi:hypothetical protein
MPKKTLRPKKKGRPKSKPEAEGSGPPSSLKALLPVPKSPRAFPIEKVTGPLG